MKYLALILALVATSVWAEDCKITTVTTEKNGQVSSDSATVCKEGGTITNEVFRGQVITEGEVEVWQGTKYFTYDGRRCRMFRENVPKSNGLYEYKGVICQLNSGGSDWIVVDKW
jgi:hypothetical protein